MDWVVASIHSPCLPGLLTEREATRLWLGVAENPYVDCIGHSEQQHYKYDYDLVARAFAARNKVVEFNGNSCQVRRDGVANMRALLRACRDNGCRIALNCDAHSIRQLQENMAALCALVEEEHFPPERIVNASSAAALAAELAPARPAPARDEIGRNFGMKYTIGIDLGGTTMTAGVVNEACEIVGKLTWPTRLPRPSKDLEKAMAELCRTVAGQCGVSLSDVEYVGIGTPGSVNFTTGFVGYNTNFGYYDWNLGPDMAALLGCRVYVENDANAAAFGEYLAGGAKGYQDAVIITLGTGIGSGIILSGKILRGFNFAAGRWATPSSSRTAAPATAAAAAAGSATPPPARSARTRARPCARTPTR